MRQESTGGQRMERGVTGEQGKCDGGGVSQMEKWWEITYVLYELGAKPSQLRSRGVHRRT